MTPPGQRSNAYVGSPEPPPAASRLDTIGAWAEARATLLLVALSAFYFAITWFFAARKLLWNDELYSFYVATQPTMSDVWGALKAGGEQTPPLFYVFTRAAFGLFGNNNLSIRLPEMLAFWGMSVCLYVFVRRRTSNLAGLVAALTPLVTSAYPYSYEARPYALVLGWAALALLSWQSASLGRSRPLWIAALAISLAATLSSHYYGLFVLLPIALGELVRTAERRRADWAVWAAMGFAVVPLVFQLPLLRAGAAYAGTFWSPPQWVNVPDFYEDLLKPALVPIVAVLVIALLLRALHRQEPAAAQRQPPLPVVDLAAAIGFVLIPVAAVVVAKIATGAFVNRYALSAVIGFAVLAGIGSALAFWRRPGLQFGLALILAGAFAFAQAREALAPTGVSTPISAATIQRAADWVNAVPDATLPVVIADPHNLAVLSHYAPPSLRARIVYAADPDRALRELGHNSVERGMLDLLQPWFHMNVVRFEPFVASHDEFLVYGDFVRLAFLNWIVPALRQQGFEIVLLNRAGDDMLLLATRQRDRHPSPDDGRPSVAPPTPNPILRRP